jgi:TonB family protein
MLTLLFIAAQAPVHSSYAGELKSEQIRAAIQDNAKAIGGCYQAELTKNKDLKGRIQTSFLVEPTGKVSAVKLRASSLNNPATEKCVLEAVKQIQFPEPEPKGIVIVNYPFNFNPANTPPLPADAPVVTDADAPDIIGDLDPAALEEGVTKARPAIDKCYAAEKKRSRKSKGVVRVTFIVGDGGTVEHSFVARSSINSTPLEACVLDAIKAQKFAAPAWGKAMVNYSFTF